MNNVREIVTRAVVAKGRKIFKLSEVVKTDTNVTSVLGCWIINHKFNTTLDNNVVKLEGTFDNNIWYSLDNNTDTLVAKATTEYNGCIKVKEVVRDTISTNNNAITRIIESPTCTNAVICEDGIKVDVVFEVIVEVIGETKMVVNVIDTCDINEVYDDFENEINEDFIKEE